MEVGLAVIGALLIGLPLVAVFGARRLPPPRRNAVRPDPLYALSREYRLWGTDLFRVQDAVDTGRRVDDQRLQPAAVAYATLVLEQHARRRMPVWLRRSRWRYVAAVLYVALAVGVLLKAPGAASGLAWVIVVPLHRREQRRKAELALAANSAPAPAPEGDTVDDG